VRQSFPDFHLTISDLIVDGDRVATRWSWSGTHTKESTVFPMPPTGKTITLTGANILHLKDGKLVEGWQWSDMLGMFRQLGIAPPMA
jgi:predicted ester cyclase